MDIYPDLKEAYTNLIKKVKSQDFASGSYLERHITFDDEKETIAFAGKEEIIKSILNKVIIKE